MALKLGCPKYIVQKYTSSSDFVLWKFKLEELANEFNPIHYYLAGIRAEIRAANVKDSSKIKLEDCLLKFEIKDPRRVQSDKKPNPKKLRAQIAQSKQNWMMATGYWNYHRKGKRKNVLRNPKFARYFARNKPKRK